MSNNILSMGRTRPGIVKQSYSYCWLKDAQRPLIGWTAVLENQLMRTHSCLVKERRVNWADRCSSSLSYIRGRPCTSELRRVNTTPPPLPHTPICLCIPYSCPKIIFFTHSGYRSSLPLFQISQFPLHSPHLTIFHLIFFLIPIYYTVYWFSTCNNICQS